MVLNVVFLSPSPVRICNPGSVSSNEPFRTPLSQERLLEVSDGAAGVVMDDGVAFDKDPVLVVERPSTAATLTQ